MTGSARLSTTAAAVLIVVGAAGWAMAPLAVSLARSDASPPPGLLRALALVLGGLLGGAVAAATLPRAPRLVIVGAAGLAAAAMLALPGGAAVGDLAAQRLVVGATVAGAAVGSLVASRMPAGVARLAAAGCLQLAVVLLGATAWVPLQITLAPTSDPWPVALVAPVLAGALAVRLIPGAGVGDVTMSWIAMAAVALALCLVVSAQRGLVIVGVIVAAFALPIPVALSALGAALARPRHAPAPDLPSATARR